MPLVAIDNETGLRIISVRFDQSDWLDLKAKNGESHHIQHPCCRARTILKTSVLGTNFFAHRPNEACWRGGRIPAHMLFARAIIARAVIDAGWEVDVECYGLNAGDVKWEVDVVAESPHGVPAQKIAFVIDGKGLFYTADGKASALREAGFSEVVFLTFNSQVPNLRHSIVAHLEFRKEELAIYAELPIFHFKGKWRPNHSAIQPPLDLAVFAQKVLAGEVKWRVPNNLQPPHWSCIPLAQAPVPTRQSPRSAVPMASHSSSGASPLFEDVERRSDMAVRALAKYRGVWPQQDWSDLLSAAQRARSQDVPIDTFISEYAASKRRDRQTCLRFLRDCGLVDK
ncbi:hypothetical protein [Chitinimonas sp. JJ19]|uniref:hypothetical protein n=1 Tax=Chitinimonas sp. JJ19 TaxID=3109352 RepID=UPI0030021DAC